MRPMLTATLLAALIAAVAPSAAIGVGSAVSSEELVENPADWDGVTVTFEGEAIGEAMVRGENAWIHINDDAYTAASVEAGARLSGFNAGMPVLLPAEAAARIEQFGSHKTQGDYVKVVGVFRAASPEQGGEMLIEGDSLEVLRRGAAVTDPVMAWKLWLGAGLAGGCVIVGLLLQRLRHSI